MDCLFASCSWQPCGHRLAKMRVGRLFSLGMDDGAFGIEGYGQRRCTEFGVEVYGSTPYVF